MQHTQCKPSFFSFWVCGYSVFSVNTNRFLRVKCSCLGLLLDVPISNVCLVSPAEWFIVVVHFVLSQMYEVFACSFAVNFALAV